MAGDFQYSFKAPKRAALGLLISLPLKKIAELLAGILTDHALVRSGKARVSFKPTEA